MYTPEYMYKKTMAVGKHSCLVMVVVGGGFL